MNLRHVHFIKPILLLFRLHLSLIYFIFFHFQFGYALGLTESSYENSIDVDLPEYIPDEDQIRMNNQKLYNPNKTPYHVENQD